MALFFSLRGLKSAVRDLDIMTLEDASLDRRRVGNRIPHSWPAVGLAQSDF